MALPEDVATVAVAVEEQHEKLRRFVDEWRWRARHILEEAEPLGALPVGPMLGNSCRDPIGLETSVRDSSAVLDLAASDNILFSKLVATLAYLCCEISFIKDQAAARFYPCLLVFGFKPTPGESTLEGEAQCQLAQALPEIQALLGQVARLRGLLVNLVQQLAILYSPPAKDRGSRLYESLRDGVHLQSVVGALAQGLGVLVTLDEIVGHNGALGHAISAFVRLAQTVKTEPSRFGLTGDQAEALQLAIGQLETATLGGGFFQRLIREDFLATADVAAPQMNRVLLAELVLCCREGLAQAAARIGSEAEAPADRELAAEHLALFVFVSWMAGSEDRKLASLAWNLQSRIPSCQLFANVALRPLTFLRSQLPPKASSAAHLKVPLKEAGITWARAKLVALESSLARDVKDLGRLLTGWGARFEDAIPPQEGSLEAFMVARLKHLSQGVLLGVRIRALLQTHLDLLSFLEEAVSRDLVHPLLQLAQQLKILEATFRRREVETALGLHLMLRFAMRRISAHLQPIKALLEAELAQVANEKARTGLSLLARPLVRTWRSTDVKLLDALAAVVASLQAADGPASRQRLAVIRLCLEILTGLNQLRVDTSTELRDLLTVVELGAGLGGHISRVTDCGFLLSSRHLLGPYLSAVYASSLYGNELQPVVSAFADGAALLWRGGAGAPAIAAYEDNLIEALEKEVVQRLCHDVDVDLRLHVHSAQLENLILVNPTKTGMRDLRSLLQLQPLRVGGKTLDLRARVELYLTATFYDHTAAALHDYRTYEEMRQLAREKYGLQVEAIPLPPQAQDQGIDVLRILTQLPSFVACYNFDLTTQVFFEKMGNAQDRRHLSTLSVEQVAASLRAHGTGIAATACHLAYRLLARKFQVFSQFLFDDHVKSRLARERRFWRERRAALGSDGNQAGGGEGAYPVERAVKFTKDIRKLGKTEEGLSFLDAFRRLIGEMGNALGIVHLVRLGTIRHATTAAGYISTLDEVTKFGEAAQGTPFCERTRKAAAILDSSIADLTAASSSRHMQYLAILVTAFSLKLRSRENGHLREFYLIAPALMVSALEAKQQANEALHRRQRDARFAAFCDDGFTLGLAYILRVLGQDKDFDALHWFDSVQSHSAAKLAALEKDLGWVEGKGGIKTPPQSEEDSQNVQLSLKQLKAQISHEVMFFHTFSAAQILFP